MNPERAKYLMEKTMQDYDEIAEEFSATRKSMWPELADLDKYTKKGDRVLDIGCGNGKLFRFLSEKIKIFSYVGLDVSEKLIKIADNNHHNYCHFEQSRSEVEGSRPSKESLAVTRDSLILPQNDKKIEFKVFNGVNIPYPDNSFDVIYCLATLPHLPGRKMQVKFLKNIRSSAKPGALLVITSWNLWQFKFISFQLKMIVNFIIDKIFGKNQYDWGDFYIPWKKQGASPIYRYYHSFTPGELRSVLEAAGWKIEELGYKKRRSAKPPRLSSMLGFCAFSAILDRRRDKNFNLFAVGRKFDKNCG